MITPQEKKAAAEKLKLSGKKPLNQTAVYDIYKEDPEENKVIELTESIDYNGHVYKLPPNYKHENGKITHMTMSKDGTPINKTVIPQTVFIAANCINSEDKSYKTELIYKDLFNDYQSIIVKNSDIAQKRQLVKLADKGLLISETNQRQVLEYLEKFRNVNAIDLPIKKTISHLGWTQDYKHFLPYSNDYFCDTLEENKKLSGAIAKKGRPEKSYKLIYDLCTHSNINYLLITCALSSLLLKFFNCGCFICHLQGESAVTGKTTIYNAIASMFGNPEQYLTRMDSTPASKRENISFLSNFPFMLDELELIPQEDKNKLLQNVYDLTEGHPKDIAKQDGSIKNNYKTWRTCIMTNGESDILPQHAKKGNLNRVIDITTEKPLMFEIERGNIKEIASENYGHIAPDFVDFLKLKFANKQKLKDKYKFIQAYYMKKYTNRQSDIGAALNMTGLLFKEFMKFKGYDLNYLPEKEITNRLKTAADIDTDKRALEYLKDIINSNRNHFITSDDDIYMYEHAKDFYGLYDNDGYLYMIPTAYNKIMQDGGFYNNRTTLLKKLYQDGLLLKGNKTYTKLKKSKFWNNKPIRTIAIKQDALKG